MLSATKPLTRQALDEHVQLLAQQDTAGDGALAPQRSPDSPALAAAAATLPQAISASKRERILEYLKAQLCMTQESLPITDASYESLPESEECLGLRTEATLSGRREGRRPAAARKSLHMPAAGTTSRAPLPVNEPMQPPAQADRDRGILSHFTSIRALPTSAKERRKRLGIFSHGKAVASHDTTETEFMHSANISRARLGKGHDSGCGDDMEANMSLMPRPLRRASKDSMLEDAVAGSSGNHNSGASRRNSVAGHNESTSSEQPDACPCPGDDFAIDDEGISSWHGPASSAEERYAAAVSIPDYNRSFYPESPFVPQSWPRARSRQERYVYDARDLAAEQDIWAAGTRAEAFGESLLYAAESYGTLPLAASDRHNSHLLQSIDECLEEDIGQENALMHSHTSGDHGGSCSLDVGFLLNRSEIGALSPFDVHNPSFGGMSAFGSSFFASQDLTRQRCAGEATVSDFAASHYGLQPTSTYVSPPPALASAGENSFDTLPEYVSRTEPPPPAYSFLTLPPPQLNNISNSSGFFREHRHFNRSRAHINMMSSSTRGDRAARRSQHGSAEFRYYPRRMN
ncbi:hypothetical protein GGI20_002961 [Coemansia sp. BCRC 34301]|nr:hypothetical protein GGI20_002961 [Coemansia sp. BCRC 34301]